MDISSSEATIQPTKVTERLLPLSRGRNELGRNVYQSPPSTEEEMKLVGFHR